MKLEGGLRVPMLFDLWIYLCNKEDQILVALIVFSLFLSIDT